MLIVRDVASDCANRDYLSVVDVAAYAGLPVRENRSFRTLDLVVKSFDLRESIGIAFKGTSCGARPTARASRIPEPGRHPNQPYARIDT